MKVAHQFLRAPTQTGAIAAASTELAERMVVAAGVSRCRTVVEFGPGTGVITEAISYALTPGTTFFALELNSNFAAKTRARCPGITVYQDNATELPSYLTKHGVTHSDAIISGLPWTLFTEQLQQALLDVIHTSLNPGGTFVTYSYVGTTLQPAGRRFRSLLYDRFPQTRKQVVWNNLPPAHVYSCTIS